jgi:tRNA(adenine34) deaminase
MGDRVLPTQGSCERSFVRFSHNARTVSGGDEELDRLMGLALDEARLCLSWNDVPVGAVVARGGEVLSSAGNQRERLGDPTAHAEILALRAAADRVGTWRLEGCSMLVTLEPCAMCAGALVLARVGRLVFGGADPKARFAGSLGDLVRAQRLNHRLDVVGDVRAEEAGALLKQFFAGRRPNTPL